MTKPGYFGITLDEITMNGLDNIKKETSCRTIPETIRLLMRLYHGK